MTDTLFTQDIDAESLAKKLVVPHIPVEEQERFFKLFSNWNGREADVICVVQYAAQKGKAPEFLEQLEKIFEEHLKWVPVQDRRNYVHPSVRRTEHAVEDLYKKLNVMPSD